MSLSSSDSQFVVVRILLSVSFAFYELKLLVELVSTVCFVWVLIRTFNDFGWCIIRIEVLLQGIIN